MATSTLSPHQNCPGFYRKPIDQRRAIVQGFAGLDASQMEALDVAGNLTLEQATQMIENVVGVYTLPLGIATNFRVNGCDVLVPMVIEEPSVVAAVSFAAKLFRAGGGFDTSSDEPIMIGQIQLLDIDDPDTATAQIKAHREQLMQLIDAGGGSIVKRGGGARSIEVRRFDQTALGTMLAVHFTMDVRDAMGANAINTAAERIAPELERLSGGRAHLRILSNLTDQRKVTARGTIPRDALARRNHVG